MNSSLSPKPHSVQPQRVSIPSRRSRPRRRWHRVALLAPLALICGCSTLGYYYQAAVGQYRIWQLQQPIGELLARPDLPADLRHKLELVVAVREFAVEHMALPDRGSYRHYADIGREFVVWNVFATPELSLEPLESCYPLVGCLEYRGFFDATRAEDYAARLRARGYDTFIGGVAAYSTLGWFNDPVLNTILRSNDVRIAEIIFHELAHQRVYVAGDTTFNESFAMAVAAAGLDAWLAREGRSAAALRAADRHWREFVDLILDFRERLAAAFAAAPSDDEKRRQKRELYAALRSEYAGLKASWAGDTSFDRWMGPDLNNAKIASIATYHDYVDAFLAIFERYDRSFERFYAAVDRLAELDQAARTSCLESLTSDAQVSGGTCTPIFE